MPKVTRICFVCLGNIVRSPLAENMFRHLAEQAGLGQKYELDSAGTGPWHVGEPPDRRMRRVAASHGFKYSGEARQVRLQDFEDFDLLIAMDTSNRSRLLELARTPEQAAKVRLMREFDPHGGPNAAVPDPYYGGIDGFKEVYQIVERSCRALLAALENGSLL
ncbi:MAG: low molecular weight phosphotyrosine protein phosphatase [Anaerolineales bacterium]|nr:low molecular weight phosphotyrosine protein phosphatase [Anaerolineales bacterium]